MPINTVIQYGIFSLLALVTVVSAFKVVLSRSVIHAAFWLFPVFAGVAGFYLYLDAQFLAAIQVLLYIGAILVLIVFAVTLTRNGSDTEDAQRNRFGLPVVLAAGALMVALVTAVPPEFWTNQGLKAIEQVTIANVPVTDVAAVGLVLLQPYLLPFEIASVLLLAAMIGAIVLARKERESDSLVCALTVETAKEVREPANV